MASWLYRKKHDYTGVLTPGPLDVGFDYHFGVPQNHGDFTGVFIENDRVYGYRGGKSVPFSRSFYGKEYLGLNAPQREDKEVMQVLTDKSIEWLKNQKSNNPFFLYFAAVGVHQPITPSDYMRGMSGCGPYGDFIQDLDYSVGQIINTLEYMGVLNNTIIIFTSDNGGVAPSKPGLPEYHAIECGLKINGELKGSKHTIWEGGTKVPFIVSWSGKIKSASISKDMINLTDVYTTFVDIVGRKMPSDKSIAPDSFSFYDSLFGKEGGSARTEMITADANGMHAIRVDGWKYINNNVAQGLTKNKEVQVSKNKPMLFELSKDLKEDCNVIEKNIDVAEKLLRKLNKIIEQGYSR